MFATHNTAVRPGKPTSKRHIETMRHCIRYHLLGVSLYPSYTSTVFIWLRNNITDLFSIFGVDVIGHTLTTIPVIWNALQTYHQNYFANLQQRDPKTISNLRSALSKVCHIDVYIMSATNCVPSEKKTGTTCHLHYVNFLQCNVHFSENGI